MTATPRTDALQPYFDRGFVEIATDSGTGSRIFVCEILGRVVKLSEDRAYHAFAMHAQEDVSDHLPQIFSHHVYEHNDSVTGYWFTLTEMEKLETLSEVEANQVIAWYTEVVANRATSGAGDLFDLWSTFQSLRELAIRSGHNLDLGKATNYMIRNSGRSRVVVITDPYN